METDSSSWGLLIFFMALLLGWTVNLAYLILLHRVRGTKITHKHNTGRALFFRTSTGDVRLDLVHRNLNFKARGERNWQTVPYDFCVSLYTRFDSKSSGIFEFFFSDFNLFDFAGRYRDVTNIATIYVKIDGDEDIPLGQLKQYEQREWALGQLLHDINLSILKKLGYYKDLDQAAETSQALYRDLLQQAQLSLRA